MDEVQVVLKAEEVAIVHAALVEAGVDKVLDSLGGTEYGPSGETPVTKEDIVGLMGRLEKLL